MPHPHPQSGRVRRGSWREISVTWGGPRSSKPNPSCHTLSHGDSRTVRSIQLGQRHTWRHALRRIAIVVLAISWHLPAEAFFCFNFGSHNAGERNFDYRHRMAYFPAPFAYPALAPPGQTQVDFNQGLPTISREKQPPEIIQGFRFRPLEERESRPESPPLQTDWRH